MKALFLMAARNLVQARRRTALLAVALVFVSFLLTMLLALSRGLSETITDNLTTLSTGHVNVTGWHKVRPSGGSPFIVDATRVREVVRAAVPEATFVIERLMGWAKIVGESNSVTAEVAGIDVTREPILMENLRVAPEREYVSGGGSTVRGSLQELADRGTIALFASQAKRMGVRVGDSVSMVSETSGGVQNVLDLRVAAVLQDRGMLTNFTVLTGWDTLRRLYNLKEESRGQLLIYLPDRREADAVMARVRKALSDAGLTLLDYDPQAYFMKFDRISSEDWVGQRFDLTTWRDYGSFVLWAVAALDTIALILVLTISVIVSVGIFNAVWIGVRERTSEIGTLRAIGMQRRQVLSLFLCEAALLAAASSLTGAGLGLAAAWILNAIAIPIDSEAMRSILMGDTLRFSPSWTQALASLLLCEVVVGLSALVPSLKAARVAPATAIRHAS